MSFSSEPRIYQTYERNGRPKRQAFAKDYSEESGVRAVCRPSMNSGERREFLVLDGWLHRYSIRALATCSPDSFAGIRARLVAANKGSVEAVVGLRFPFLFIEGRRTLAGPKRYGSNGN